MSGERVKVLYIAGSGRSGSTILDRILGQLDGFFSVGELLVAQPGIGGGPRVADQVHDVQVDRWDAGQQFGIEGRLGGVDDHPAAGVLLHRPVQPAKGLQQLVVVGRAPAPAGGEHLGDVAHAHPAAGGARSQSGAQHRITERIGAAEASRRASWGRKARPRSGKPRSRRAVNTRLPAHERPASMTAAQIGSPNHEFSHRLVAQRDVSKVNQPEVKFES